MIAISRILQQHFSEYAQLLPIYRELRSDDHCTEDGLHPWQQRLAAHMDGLLVDPQATAALVEDAFERGESVGAAAAVAVQLDPVAGTQRALQFLESCDDPALATDVSASLCETCADASRCEAAVDSSHDFTAIAAVETRSRRGHAIASSDTIKRLLSSPLPEVRQAAWRVVGDASLSA